MKALILLSLITAFTLLIGCKRNNTKEENLMTFAKVYGYVKYFHPSDEASQIDWNKFSIYGAAEISNCKSPKHLVNKLNDLFKPIAPSIVISTQIEDCEIDSILWIPDDTSNCQITFWRHHGVSIGMMQRSQVYSSQRAHRTEKSPLFNYEPEFGETILKEVGDGIWCMVPIAVYCDSLHTYPISDHKTLKRLMVEIEEKSSSDPKSIFLRQGNVINVYNVFQHFYPYMDVIDINWENELYKALYQCTSDSTLRDHLWTLERFTAPLKDGHIGVYNEDCADFYLPPISWEWIEGKLIITKNSDKKIPVSIGDEITKIEGHHPGSYFDEIFSRISAGTNGWLHYKANEKSLQGAKNSKISLELNGTSTVEIERIINPYRQKDSDTVAKYRELEKGVWYLNLDIIEMDTIKALIPRLNHSNAIVCDLRGYPNDIGLIRHLMSEIDTSKSWMQIPQIVYPDLENIVGYSLLNWMDFMKPLKPYLGDKDVIFITDGRAISYAESYMGFVEGYDLATIVGQPTAGTNGNVNLFELPGGYSISWTGMKVLKHDGSQHHSVGILPDIYVEKTIQGVMDGHDEFLEKAILQIQN